MSFQRLGAGELSRHDSHAKVATPIFRAGMSGMTVAVVDDLERLGSERRFEARSYTL
jgi:hypothetical protein